jgi:hypothetical protein
MDWRTANDLPGGADCAVDELRAEVERLRTEAARLLALFAEQWQHPASALYFTALALGHKTIPASLVGEPHSRQLAHDEPIPAHMLDSDHYRPRGLRGRDDQPQP